MFNQFNSNNRFFMFQKIVLLFALSVMLSCKTHTETKITFFNGANPAFEYSGRIEMHNDTIGALISSASNVIFKAKSDSISFFLSAQGDSTSYAVVELNGKFYQRYKIFSDSLNQITLPISTEIYQEVGLYKATEASNGPLLFYGVKSKNVQQVDKKTSTTIEYIGDSITCGFGADTEEIPCDTGTWYDQHNAYLAYGPLVARQLNAGYSLSSVSGMGIYRNWNDEDTAPIMNDVYATTNLDGDMTKRWDFSNKKPDLVSICLGTNDLSDGDGQKPRKPFDSDKFVNGYIALVKKVFDVYPNTKVALLTSPMLSAEKNEMLLKSLTKVKAQFNADHIVSIFEFEAMQPTGCGSHPNLSDHKLMAAQLVPFYAELLKK